MQTTVLFGKPQQEIASLIRAKLLQCQAAWLVTGFATPEGVDAVAAPLLTAPGKLQALIIGAGTYRGFEALDNLVTQGVQINRLFVHLGHTRQSTKKAKNPFYRYHPMLHSKVYLFEMPGGTAVAFIGSHNLTGFALNGLNGEASVMIEGSMGDPEFQEIKRHIDHAKSQAVPYAPSMKEAYTWWMTQFVDGLWSKVNDKPRDTEARKTVIILAAEGSDGTPSEGETVYFELPEALRRIGSLNAEVHIYIFDKPIASPVHGLSMLHTAKKTLWCKTQGLELDQGGQELLADWQVLPRGHDSLKRTSRPFRPRPAKGMQQVRAEVYNEVFSQYEYLFDEDKQTWVPDLDRGSAVRVPDEEAGRFESLKLIPPEHFDWYLVRGLRGSMQEDTTGLARALEQSRPEAGSYILFSRRRRDLSKAQKKESEAEE